MTARRKFTLADIAAECGVSRMTVSRVLRNDPKVSNRTRQLVIQAAEQAGFVPSAGRGGSDSTVGRYHIVFQQEDAGQRDFNNVVIAGLHEEITGVGGLCSFDFVRAEYSDLIRLINSIQHDTDMHGLFLVGDMPLGHFNALLELFPHAVLVDNTRRTGIQWPHNTVACDNIFGAYTATRHLLALGRKRIMVMVGRPGHYFSDDLLQGYKGALAEDGLAFDPTLIVHSNFVIQGGYEAMQQALQEGMEFDALFSNDAMACGAMRAMQEKGLNIPGDVSVVGFDNLPLSKATNPPLTTINVDPRMMGRLAARRLLEIDREKDKRPLRISIYPRLLVRGSCGADKPRG